MYCGRLCYIENLLYDRFYRSQLPGPVLWASEYAVMGGLL
jgi:hypothetical protein